MAFVCGCVCVCVCVCVCACVCVCVFHGRVAVSRVVIGAHRRVLCFARKCSKPVVSDIVESVRVMRSCVALHSTIVTHASHPTLVTSCCCCRTASSTTACPSPVLRTRCPAQWTTCHDLPHSTNTWVAPATYFHRHRRPPQPRTCSPRLSPLHLPWGVRWGERARVVWAS